MYSIGFVHGDTVPWGFVDSWIGSDGIYEVIEERSGPNTGPARNQVVQRFMDSTKPDWLLLVDTDMVWSRDQLSTLFDRADPKKRPVLGALHFVPDINYGVRPVLFAIDDEDKIFQIWSYPEDIIAMTGLAPVAFCLVHRRVLDTIGDPWFSYEYNGKTYSDESYSFSFKLRDHNIPVHIDTRIKVGHLRSIPLTEKMYPTFQRTSNEWWKESDGSLQG